MSVVTTVLIATSTHEEVGEADAFPAIAVINARLGGEWLLEVGRHAGGNKVPEACVFMGAINHLDLDQFKAHMRSAPWRMPEAVMLLTNEDGEDGFQVERWRAVKNDPPLSRGMGLSAARDPSEIDSANPHDSE